MVATNGDACLIGVLLLWSYFTDDLGVRDLMVTFEGNVVVGGRSECACRLVGSVALAPMPWHRRPSLSAYEVSQMALYVGWHRSWRWPSRSPVSLLRTGRASPLVDVVLPHCMSVFVVSSVSSVASAAKAFVDGSVV